MNWQQIMDSNHLWLNGQGAQNDVVISSRIRLARNLVEAAFPARLDAQSQHAVLTRVKEAVETSPSFVSSVLIDMAETKKLDRQFLMERHLISPEMAFGEGYRGVAIRPGQGLTLMINEEDHIRLQSFQSGLGLTAAWKLADKADNELSERLNFAFDGDWGFCTRCPTNMGTGMRASALLHLPALVLGGDLQKILASLAQMGVTARGFYGERSKALGDLYQISNGTSLGQSETELLETIERVVNTLAQHERQSREALKSGTRQGMTEDGVYRAWGILRHARSMSYDEAMSLMSHVRLGLELDMNLPVDTATLNHLMLVTQPAHLQLLKGSALKAEAASRWRATLIRQTLGEQEHGTPADEPHGRGES